MADKLEFKDTNKKKEPWSAKKVITTIIIAVLSLLMIGGAYYIVVLINDSTDDTYVFGSYDGEKIKLEPGTVFYNEVMNNEDYYNAYLAGDYSSMMSVMLSAYQNQVVMLAALEKTKEAKIGTPKDLVNDLIISSGVYASADGSSSFDPDVYKNADQTAKDYYYEYMKNRLPYAVFTGDIQSVIPSSAELEFIGKMSADTIGFDYFTVDYLAYPDSLAKEFDTSVMEKSVDENGVEIEPSLEEIKYYIFTTNPEEVQPYIDQAYNQALVLAESNFSLASINGNGVQSVSGAMNNVGESTLFLNGANNFFQELNEIYSEEVAEAIYNAEPGTVLNYPTSTGYLFISVGEPDNVEEYEYYTEYLYQSYLGSTVFTDFANAVLTSDKHTNDFYNKFITLVLGN